MTEIPSSSPVQDTSPPVEKTGRRVNVFGMNMSLGALLAWAALLVLLVVLALGLRNTQKGSAAVGDVPEDFILSTFDGQQINTADLRGKVVVINFWASWCKPCEQEAADLESAWQNYKDRGDVVFLGVDYVDTEPEALGYLEKFNITYPNGPDLGTRVSQAYRIRGVPETYFLNQQGELVYRQVGPFTSLAQIISVIDPLLTQ